MKKIVIMLLLIMIIIPLHSQKEDDEALIKRAVLILPFNNENDIENYNYLADTLLDTLKSQLLSMQQFNFPAPIDVDAKINAMQLTLEELIKHENAKKLAVDLEADVIVIGKYIIIDESIMVSIQAIDIFTNRVVAGVTKKGNLGIDIFRIIEESTNELADIMEQKFPEVTPSYFKHMKKVLRRQNPKLSPLNKVGIGLIATGSTLLVGGLVLLLYDLTFYSNVLTHYKKNLGYDVEYWEYENSYNMFVGFLIGSIVGASVGLIIDCIGIPFVIYRKKTNNLSFSLNINVKRNLAWYISLKL